MQENKVVYVVKCVHFCSKTCFLTKNGEVSDSSLTKHSLNR